MTPDSPVADRLTIRLLALAAVLAVVLSVWPVMTAPGEPGHAWRVWSMTVSLTGLIAFNYWHPYRALGFVAPALTVGLGAAVAAAVWDWVPVVAAVFGAGASSAFFGLANAREGYSPWTGPSRATRVGIAGCVVVGVLPFLFLERSDPRGESVRRLNAVAAAVVLGPAALFAWLRLFRPAFELCAEPVLWVMYKVRAAGPGLVGFPTRGPCLVVANHACWLDPVFVAKVLPRRITPMMTSKFYDVPLLRRLMRSFGVIRVPDATYKQDPAEIREAIAALDRGECVVIFPEGFLRRSEEKLLKRFGRGAWQILQARPNTPVFTCWIEGAWGSYCSYYNGKPMKNKKPDFRRPIGVGVSAAVVVDPATLESHLPTRVFLMNRVAEARKHLGLPEVPAFEFPRQTEEKDGDADDADSGADTRGSEQRSESDRR
jgi:1-acyl-sn-glycerol-3-phosphate acyltransferase